MADEDPDSPDSGPPPKSTSNDVLPPANIKPSPPKDEQQTSTSTSTSTTTTSSPSEPVPTVPSPQQPSSELSKEPSTEKTLKTSSLEKIQNLVKNISTKEKIPQKTSTKEKVPTTENVLTTTKTSSIDNVQIMDKVPSPPTPSRPTKTIKIIIPPKDVKRSQSKDHKSSPHHGHHEHVHHKHVQHEHVHHGHHVHVQEAPKETKKKRYKGPAVKVLNKKGFEVIQQIGYGAYSKVFKVSKNGKEYAVKVIAPWKQSIRYNTTMLPRELKVLSHIRHENIVKVKEIYQEPKGDFVLIIMKMAANGTMKDQIKKHGPYNESKAKEMFKGMASAINYMHHQTDPIAHRDLKLDNVLIDKNGVPKITDFSYTRYTLDHSSSSKNKDGGGHRSSILSETYCGTEPFLAPEVLMNRPYDPLPADIWSLGVCLYAMLNGRTPFHGEGEHMIHQQRTRNYRYVHPYDRTLSVDVKDLISKMLEPNPHKRVTIEEVLNHKWLKDGQ